MHLATRDSYSETPRGRKARRSRTGRQRPVKGEPTWELAQMFPMQGNWSEEDYFALENRGIEFSKGFLEFLPVPTELHQLIIWYFCNALQSFARPEKAGLALTSGIKIFVAKGVYREPDVAFVLAKHYSRRGQQYWSGADLVLEVVSEGGEAIERDYAIKRREYAAAGIAEYWIADPQENKLTVLKLKGRRYVTDGIYKPGDTATSALLPEFKVDVRELLTGKVD